MKDINSLINKIQDQDSRNVRGGSGTTKKVLEKIVENLEQLNEAGFVTKDVDDLENYNTKAQEAEIYATKQQLGGYYTKEQTDAMLATLGNGSYVVAWDGSSEPVVANIPAGVTVTYDGTDYTGTLDASASTKENIYLVGQDMYITSVNDSTYSWLAAGTTELDLSGYATDAELSQLEAKVTDLGGYPKSVQDTFTMAETGKYIKWNTATPGTLNNSFYSEPIPVKAHCKYTFRSRGYSDVFSMISSCDSEGGNIKQEVRSIDSTVRDYEYTPYYDGYIIVSGYTTTDHLVSHIEAEDGIIKEMGENIESLNAQVLPIVDYENCPSGVSGYVGKNGGYSTNNSYTCVKPVPVKKGDIIDYYCRVENDNIAVIAKTNQAGDTYEPLVLGVDGTARHYTYTCDFDGYVALSGYGNPILRTYPRELTITHISRIDEKIRDSHKGIVFVGASEKYKTITEGCMAAKNGDVVIVFPGVYDESVNLSCKDCYEAGETLPDGTTATQRTMVENLDHYRSLTIIGTDREKCILTNSTGKYATPALWITDGCVKNMTILGYAGPGTIRQNYAVHIDYYYTSDKSLTFENCYIMTECFACLGCGCKKDLVLTIKDCILENKSTMANTSAVGIHTSSGAPMEARFFNNVIHSYTSERVLQFTHNQASTYGGKLNVVAVGNACKSDASGTDCVYISDTSDNHDAITMDTRNWNNQATALNS